MFHLARRYFGSFRPGSSAADGQWALDRLEPGEQRLFNRLTTYDQRHAIESAQWADQELATMGVTDRAPFVAAVLLHDVGKYHAQLDPTRRAVATVLGSAAGRPTTRAWSQRSHGFLCRVGMYVEHGPIGADDLRDVGARPEAIAWSAAHHEPPSTWDALNWPDGVAAVLDRADHI